MQIHHEIQVQKLQSLIPKSTENLETVKGTAHLQSAQWVITKALKKT